MISSSALELYLYFYLLFGIQLDGLVFFFVSVKQFWTADKTDITKRRKWKKLSVLSGVLTMILIAASVGYFIFKHTGLSVMLLIYGLAYDFIFALPLIMAVWFIVSLVRLTSGKTVPEHRHDLVIETVVTGCIAGFQILVMLGLLVWVSSVLTNPIVFY